MSNTRLVFSTEGNNHCKKCERALKKCQCLPVTELKKKSTNATIKVQYERKGRKGNGVCVIKNLTLPMDELKTLTKELKMRCGSGGSIKNQQIEIQGDHRDSIKVLLESKQYKVKIAGG